MHSDQPAVEAEVVDQSVVLPSASTLRYTPVPAPKSCRCGKDGTPFAHGLIPGRSRPFSCDEVLAIRARVEFAQLPWHARLMRRLRGNTPEEW